MRLKNMMMPARDDYLELVKRFPLRVIRNERELDAATQVGLQVAARGEAALSEGQTQYLDVLDRLIEDYEDAFRGSRQQHTQRNHPQAISEVHGFLSVVGQHRSLTRGGPRQEGPQTR
jgi:hypothetical protein